MYKHGGRLCSMRAGGIYRATCLLSFSRPHVSSGRLCACAAIVDAAAVVCAQRAISGRFSGERAYSCALNHACGFVAVSPTRTRAIRVFIFRSGQKGNWRYLCAHLLYDARQAGKHSILRMFCAKWITTSAVGTRADQLGSNLLGSPSLLPKTRQISYPPCASHSTEADDPERILLWRKEAWRRLFGSSWTSQGAEWNNFQYEVLGNTVF